MVCEGKKVKIEKRSSSLHDKYGLVWMFWYLGMPSSCEYLASTLYGNWAPGVIDKLTPAWT